MANAIISLVLRAKDEASGALKSTAAKVTALIAAFAGGAAIKNTVSELTELDTAAKRLGVSMEDLTAAQYAAFQGANVSPDQFVDALEEVRIKVEEFSSIGSGGATDFFEVLNADVDEFNKLNPLEQLQKISETLDGMPDASAFTFLDQIGSDSLRNLLPILKNGGSEMERLMGKAKDLGLTLSDEETMGVNKLGKSFNQLTSVVGTTFDKIVASVAPQLSALFDTVTDTVAGVAGDAEKPIKSIGDTFTTVIEGIVKGFGFLSKAKAVFDVFRHGVAQGLVWLVKNWLTQMQTVEKIVITVVNSVTKKFGGMFSKIISVFENNFVAPIHEFQKAFNFNDAAKSTQNFRNKLAGIRDDLEAGKGISLKPSDNLDGMIKNLENLGDEIEKNGIAARNQIFDNDWERSGNKFLEGYKNNLERVQGEIADETVARATKTNDEIVVKLQEKNIAAAASIMETRAQLAADLAKLEIDKTISSIDTKRNIELSGLQARARAENLNALQIADMRLSIESEAARKIAEQRKALIDQDISILKAQIKAQQKIMSGEANSGERAVIGAEIVAIEAEIYLKKREQLMIGAELVNQQAILKAERAADLDLLKEQLQTIREDAEIELKALRGNQLGADLDRIEKEFADTIRDMEALGEDSTAVKELISVKKAKAEIDQIEREYAELKKRLDRGEIGGFEFLRKSGELENRGMEQASITGDKDDGERMRELSEDAQAEIFDMQGAIDNLEESMANGLTNAFAGIIDGSKTAKEAFADFANSMLANIAQMISKLLVQLAIQSMLNALSGGTSAAAGGASKMLSGMSAGLNHTGGLVGKSGISKRVSPLAFAGAMKYHTGGIVGLKANEVPIVAEQGEEVLTQTDPRHRKNLGKSGGKEEQQKITINNVIDSQSIASALEGSDGERVIMNHLRANRAEIKSL